MGSAAGITLEELLAWNDEAAGNWKTHLEANPALLELPCGINGAANVQALVRHIWGAELRWSHRLAGLPEVPEAEWPAGPLETLFTLHTRAVGFFRTLLTAPAESWNEPYELKFDWLAPEKRRISRRKVAGHMLLHSQRHYAQLATLVRVAGYPVTVMGDLLLSAALG